MKIQKIGIHSNFEKSAVNVRKASRKCEKSRKKI